MASKANVSEHFLLGVPILSPLAPNLPNQSWVLFWGLSKTNASLMHFVFSLLSRYLVGGLRGMLRKGFDEEGLPYLQFRFLPCRDLVGGKNVRLSRGQRLRAAGERLALDALIAGGCYAAWTTAFPPG